MKLRVTTLLLAMALVVGFSVPARAMPGEWAIGGELGAGRSTRTSWSPSLGVRGAYGIAEALDVQVEVSGQWLRRESSAASKDDALVRLVPSLVYKLDVLRWVPFARLGGGPVWSIPLSTEQGPRIAFGVQGALGAEYLVDRSLSLAVAYQADWVVGSNELAAGLAPMHRLVLSLTWRSGW